MLNFHTPSTLKDVNQLESQNISYGQRVADSLAAILGSWRFIITQSIILVGWLILNIISWVQHWDPYPFILMNLFLSLQAAYAAPIIIMSQNRQIAHDRLEAHNDFLVNQKAEEEICLLIHKVEAQSEEIQKIYDLLIAQGK
ncbi:MAG: DUF1003 domain-containing protein [Gammaproteobacteria bacterium]|nr:DUF1003 domain-containing protein [Gammaproteobacteria bacterium]MBP9728856.1 DUF1003 domain-containing protein [Gammaproteobacteria bacterium]